MWQQFTQPAREAIWRAQAIAIERKCAEVEGAHLFLGVIAGDDEVIATLLQVSGVVGEEARLYAASALQSERIQPDGGPTLSPDAKRIFRLAFMESNRTHNGAIGPEHLLIACVAQQRGPHLGEVLRPLGLDAARLREHLQSLNALKTPYKKGNPLNSLTQQSAKAVEAAHAAMRASFCGRISTSHLLLGLLSDENFASVTLLQDIGADLEALKRRARESIAHDGHIAGPQKKFSPGAKRALERAARGAKAAGHGFIGTDHLLRALLPQPQTWREKLKAGGQNFDSVESLWTADEVAAMKLALGSAPKFVIFAPVPKLKVQLILGGGMFTIGLLCDCVLSSKNWFNPSASDWVSPTPLVAVLLWASVTISLGSLIGLCVTLISPKFRYARNIWFNVFLGWVSGAVAGQLLVAIL